MRAVSPVTLLALGVLAAAVAVAAPAAAASATALAPGSSSHWLYACGAVTRAKLHCMVIKNTAARPTALTMRPGTFPSGEGYSPAQLQAAYKLTAASAADGSGTTVAVVDAFGDPTAASDLAEYRSATGLPALWPGQFTQYNQEGQTSPLPQAPPAKDDWTLEDSLDIDMVSAICPLCKIDLVEADSDSGKGLYIAEETAATTLGAKYISNSWGGPEASSDTTLDSVYFSTPGVVYVASAGDKAYKGGVSYPAASPRVVSVGGTKLEPSSDARGWTESVWMTSPSDGTGSGCSAYEPAPSWQKSIPIIAGACSFRVDNDAAADADPATGAAIYDTSNGNGGWAEVGGTSESAPIIAAVLALASNDGNNGNKAAASIYAHTRDLNKVTASSNGTCTPPAAHSVLCTATGKADTYNGPTGWGTPDGIGGFASNSAIAGCPPQQLLRNPGFATGTLSPWTSDNPGLIVASTAGGPPAQGSDIYFAWLDGYSRATVNTLAQKVTIPAKCKSAVFKYWVEVNSDVTDKAKQKENNLVLEILNPSGKVLRTVHVAHAIVPDPGYIEYSTNLDSYIGQTITVKFIGTEVDGGQTSFFEDSNALNVR